MEIVLRQRAVREAFHKYLNIPGMNAGVRLFGIFCEFLCFLLGVFDTVAAGLFGLV